jgi:hypothetical protein
MIDAPDLLALWERGVSRHPLDRSALLCARARPELPVESIADLPLGEVTASALRLRSAWFGERISAHVDCERCKECLQLNISVGDLLQPGAPVARVVDAPGGPCRPLSLRDLAAVAREHDPDLAARQLFARCRLEPAAAHTAVPETNLSEIEDALEAADPNADLAFDVRCEACGHVSTAQLDASALLWEEIDTHARTLLGEVHLLARAYGWTESEVLALSAARRASYLSMVMA